MKKDSKEIHEEAVRSALYSINEGLEIAMMQKSVPFDINTIIGTGPVFLLGNGRYSTAEVHPPCEFQLCQPNIEYDDPAEDFIRKLKVSLII